MRRPETPPDWADAFPQAPELIAERPASVRLTRSILKEHKQLLKQQLNFAGYRIGELYPRRTRRATAVNWLLAWLAQQGEPLPEQGPWGGASSSSRSSAGAPRRSAGAVIQA